MFLYSRAVIKGSTLLFTLPLTLAIKPCGWWLAAGRQKKNRGQKSHMQVSPEVDCSRYFMGVLVGSPSLRLTESEKRAIFRVHLERALKDMRLDEEDKVTHDTMGVLYLFFCLLRSSFLRKHTPKMSLEYLLCFYAIFFVLYII